MKLENFKFQNSNRSQKIFDPLKLQPNLSNFDQNFPTKPKAFQLKTFQHQLSEFSSNYTDSDVGNLKLVTFLGYWPQNFDVGACRLYKKIVDFGDQNCQKRHQHLIVVTNKTV